VFLSQSKRLYQDMQFVNWYPHKHILVWKWVLELHSNKNKIQKQTKCGARSENTTFLYQAKYKRVCNKRKKNNFWLKIANLWHIICCNYKKHTSLYGVLKEIKCEACTLDKAWIYKHYRRILLNYGYNGMDMLQIWMTIGCPWVHTKWRWKINNYGDPNSRHN
jgi:hypothetical protein